MEEDKTLNEQPTPRPPLKSLESLQASVPISPSAHTKFEVDTRRTRDFYFLPIPRHLQYDPDKPPPWGLYLNVIFAAATTIFVANLYYCQPILIQLSQSLNVSYNQVSNVPTLIQAGYATGLLLIAPLGDLVLRRPLVLLLCFASTALTFGLAFTHNFIVFEVISFILGVVTCASQVLAPLTADLAPEARRASALSVLTAGTLLGILWARVMAGLIAQFVSWRVVYYTAIGIQASITFVLYWTLPDYPIKNTGLTYGRILFTMAKYAVTEPLLIQASLVSMVSMACFTNFWVTLTFLLGGPPYNYSTLVIGLFGLVGVLGVFTAPLVGRTIDHLIPWFATVISTLGLIIFQAIQTGAGGINIAAVVIVCFGLDVFRQYQQVSLTTAVFGIEASARSRLNAVVWLSVFVGQIMGTAVGTQVFIKYGWRPAAALSVAWSGFTLLVMLVRGPHCPRYTWFGYEGGLELRKSRLSQPEQQHDLEKGGELATDAVTVVVHHVYTDVESHAPGEGPEFQECTLPDEDDNGHDRHGTHDGSEAGMESQGTTAHAEHREGKPAGDHDHREADVAQAFDIQQSALLSAESPARESPIPTEVEQVRASVELRES